MKEKVDSKVCGVCGDKALGYNFNAITCESCKAFFRRNALLQKPFVCPFNQECDINTVTRRFCQKCRLDKCFAIGMCKDLIMSEQDKVLKRQKIEENRARKRSTSGFKHGFKKMRKETAEADSQNSSNSFNNTVYTTDSNSSKELNSDQPYTPNYNTTNFSGLMYSNDELKGANEDISIASPNERLVSSSDDVSMIRSILTNPDSANRKITEDNTLLSTLIGTNEVIPAGSDTSYDPPSNSNMNSNNDLSDTNTFNSKQLLSQESSRTYKPPVDVTRDVVEDVQRVPVEPNSIESILCEAIKLEFEAYTSLAQCHSNSRELNDAERAKLTELIVANKALTTPLDDEINNLMGDDSKFKQMTSSASSTQQQRSQDPDQPDPVLLDVINLTAIVIRRLIKTAKKINAFKNMCQEDQVALLKGGCTEIMILRSAMNYDPKKETWKIPHSQENLNINVDILKLAKGNCYQELDRFMKTFDAKWRADENIVLIMCAITLFSPDRPKVVHQDVIKLEQNSYYYLLRRYLESVYPGCEAKSTFLKLIQKISELHRLNEEMINIYLDVNPSQVEPLLIEIFDLKHR